MLPVVSSAVVAPAFGLGVGVGYPFLGGFGLGYGGLLSTGFVGAPVIGAGVVGAGVVGGFGAFGGVGII